MHAPQQMRRQNRSRPVRSNPVTDSPSIDLNNGTASTGDSESIEHWLARVQQFGFAAATTDVIRQLSGEQLSDFMQCVKNWEREHV
ncbi:MAG: hypothetical protein JWM11_3595, partial [Planctomycetaceae bacterium]|nr:hypothetical protein [Planctomycetaceae bacterium]